MNLRYYLRGLGLGILVTAFILSIAGRNRQAMTDAEVKERAKELGMIENTVLVQKEVDTENPAEEKTPTESTSKEEVTPAESTIKEEKTPTEGTSKEEVTPAESTTKEEKTPTESAPEDEENLTENSTKEDLPEEDSLQESSTELSDDPERPNEPSKNHTEEPQSEVAEEEVSTAGSGQNRTDAVTLTIVSGDTSYSVAKKLFDLGIVPSVEQTDRFLCSNGYDRTIRTGVYTIAPEETLESIAKRINGK